MLIKFLCFLLFFPGAPLCFCFFSWLIPNLFMSFFLWGGGRVCEAKTCSLEAWLPNCGSFMNVAWPPRSSSRALASDTRVISYPCHVGSPINYAAGSAKETILTRLPLAPLCGKYKHILIRDERTFECLALWVNRSRCLQEALLSLCHASPWGSVFILSL